MCFTVYIGTTERLPVGEFKENETDIYFEELSADEEPVKAKFNNRFIYHVGSDTRCSCGLQFLSERYYEEEWQAKRRSPLRFIEFIKERTTKEDVEFYCCWFGEWSEPVEDNCEIDISEISLESNYFGLKERQFILFRKQLV